MVGYRCSDSTVLVLALAVAVDSCRTSLANDLFWGGGFILFYFIFNTLCELSIYQCHCKRRPPRWLFINSVQSDSAVGVWLFKVLSGTVWALAAKERLDGVISHNTVLNLVERLNVLQKARWRWCLLANEGLLRIKIGDDQWEILGDGGTSSLAP